MAIEKEQFRIIQDPEQPGKWAYELLYHDRYDEIVGGFKTSKDARRAVDRHLKQVKK